MEVDPTHWNGRGLSKRGGSTSVELEVKGQTEKVRCFTTNPRPWDQASDGQQINMRGQFVGLGDAAQMYHCTILQATGPKTPTLTATQLASVLDSNPAITMTKYKNKGLLVKGTVAKKEQISKNELRIYFKTEFKVQIYAEIVWGKSDWADKLQAGDKLRVLGNFSNVSPKNELALGFAVDAGPED